MLEQGRLYLLSGGSSAATAHGRVLLTLATFYVDMFAILEHILLYSLCLQMHRDLWTNYCLVACGKRMSLLGDVFPILINSCYS